MVEIVSIELEPRWDGEPWEVQRYGKVKTVCDVV